MITKDIDGNIYHTVKIGKQIWLKENLKVTKFNDGTLVSIIKSSEEWGKFTTPGCCWYENDYNKYVYGVLYNWYAVNTGKLAPKSFHIPTDKEWDILVKYLGGENVAGGKLKESGFEHWKKPNEAATNETGFTALPGGYRYNDGTFDDVGYYGYWWSATEYDASNAWKRYMYSNNANVNRDYNSKRYGFSVRCVRD